MRQLPLILVLFLVLSLPAASWGLDLRLPDMGDAVDQVLPPKAEVALGEEFFAHLRQQHDFIDDPLILGYIQDLGQRLVSATGTTTFDFKFEIIDDGTINAFAVPGGFIGVNSGLFLLAENESELAGVLAHEIAHGVQRHIARMFAGQGMSNLTALAGIVGAVLLGSVSPDAAAAAATAGMAGAAQRQINFTRAHEHEADRIAIQTLYRAGIDPTGMITFFEKMQRREIAGSPMNQLSYLRTHPLTSERIAGAQSRVESLPPGFSGSRDSLEFGLAQARLAAVTGRAPTQRLSGTAADYHEALRLLLSNRPAQALPRMETLSDRHPGLLWFELPRAQALHRLGREDEADRALAELEKLYPDNSRIVLQRAQWAIMAGEPEQALAMTRAALRNTPNDPLLHLARAKAAEATGDLRLHHEAMGQFFLRNRRLIEAHQEFRKAYPYSAGDPIAQQRLDAAMTEIEKQLRPEED